MVTISNLNAPHDLKVTYGDEITARKGDIIDLAVAYQAFHQNAAIGASERTKAWAQALKAAQEKTGVELCGMDILRDYL